MTAVPNARFWCNGQLIQAESQLDAETSFGLHAAACFGEEILFETLLEMLGSRYLSLPWPATKSTPLHLAIEENTTR